MKRDKEADNRKFHNHLKKFFDSFLKEIYFNDAVQKMEPSQRNRIALSAGKDLHLLIKKYTNIDTYKK